MALSSIYDESTFLRSSTEQGGCLSISLSLPYPVQLEATLQNDQPPVSRIFHHLPPLTLNFQLPAGYPSSVPPQYILSCKWLSRRKLSILCNSLDGLYQAGDVVLFQWIQFLSNEAAELLGIRSPFKLEAGEENQTDVHCSAVQDIPSVALLWPFLINFDEAERKRVFDSSFQTCPVCLESKLGVECVKLSPCSHHFCRQCMTEYLEIQISDGSVSSLKCPDPACDSHAPASLVKELVKPELFARYDRLLLQRSLDGMEDIVYCPRKICQCAVLKEKETTMAVCPRCLFAFCILCQRAWHGVNGCNFKTEMLKSLRKEYEAGSAAKKAFLEKKYGKKTIQTATEELVSEEWIEENAKQCPSCKSPIQKIDGCNKMTCRKCHCLFCWLCMEVLSMSNPYQHFNSQKSPCFNLLFQGMDLGDDDDEVVFR